MCFEDEFLLQKSCFCHAEIKFPRTWGRICTSRGSCRNTTGPDTRQRKTPRVSSETVVSWNQIDPMTTWNSRKVLERAPSTPEVCGAGIHWVRGPDQKRLDRASSEEWRVICAPQDECDRGRHDRGDVSEQQVKKRWQKSLRGDRVRTEAQVAPHAHGPGHPPSPMDVRNEDV